MKPQEYRDLLADQVVVSAADSLQDLEDIRALMRANRKTLNLAELREYFQLFNRETLLDELLSETD